MEAEDEEEDAPPAPELGLPDPPVQPSEKVERDDTDEQQEDGEDDDLDVSSLVFPTDPPKTTWRDARTADSYSSAGEEGVVSHHSYSLSSFVLL